MVNSRLGDLLVERCEYALTCSKLAGGTKLCVTCPSSPLIEEDHRQRPGALPRPKADRILQIGSFEMPAVEAPDLPDGVALLVPYDFGVEFERLTGQPALRRMW